jgi:hypothetical protein
MKTSTRPSAALVDVEKVAAEEGEGLVEVGERQHHEKIDGDRERDARQREGVADGRDVERSELAARDGGAALERQRLGDAQGDPGEVDEAQARRDEAGDRAVAAGDLDAREDAADAGAGDEAEAEGHADEAHALGAVLGRGDVGDVGAGGAEVGGGDAAEDASREEKRDARAPHEPEAQAGHGDRRAGDRPEQDRAAADAVRQAAPDRHEQELHQRVGRGEQGRGERADAEGVASLFGEERQHEAEAEQVDEDRQEDGAQPRLHAAARL